MKNFIIIILVAIVVLIGSTINQEEVITDSVSYDVEGIEKISINVDQADVNITAAEVDQIQVEATYSKDTEEQEHYFSYIEDNTLYIDNYIVKDTGILNTDAKINVYVPIESNVSEINVDIDYGSISASDIEMTTFNIFTNEADVNVSDCTINNLRIETNFANVAVKNTISEQIDIVGEKANIILDHVNSKVININSEIKMVVDFVYCVTNEFNITGNEIELLMTLYDNINYNITSNTIITAPNFMDTNSDGIYEYKAVEPVDTATFNFTNVEVENILMVQK